MTKCCNSGGFVGRGVSHDMNAANSERHQPLKYLFAFITPKRQCACHPERSPALFLSRPVAAGRARTQRGICFSPSSQKTPIRKGAASECGGMIGFRQGTASAVPQRPQSASGLAAGATNFRKPYFSTMASYL